MIVQMENFEDLTVPSTGIADTRWLSRIYDITGNPSPPSGAYPFLSIRNFPNLPEPRIGAHCSSGSTPNSWAISVNLGTAPLPRTSYVSFKVLGVPTSSGTSSSAPFGLIHKVGGALLGVVFMMSIINRNTLRLIYEAQGQVVREDITVAPGFFGTYDTVEVGMVKVNTDPATKSLLTIWVNNRAIFSRNILTNVGDVGELYWTILGTMEVPQAGQGRGNTYVASNLGSAQVGFGFGVTDLVVSDNSGSVNTTRIGRTRVVSRLPSGDIGPNLWSLGPSGGPDHFDIVSTVPPDDERYLETETLGLTERYSAAAFPDLGSEAVLAMEVRTFASKADPLGPDVRSLLASGSTTVSGPTQPLTIEGSVARYVSEVNPGTGLTWQANEANASTFGFESQEG